MSYRFVDVAKTAMGSPASESKAAKFLRVSLRIRKMKLILNEATKMPITILALAKHRGAQGDPHGRFSLEAIEKTGLPFWCGCACSANLGPHNAYPSKSGFTACYDCIGTNGFETVEEANLALFGEEECLCGHPNCELNDNCID